MSALLVVRHGQASLFSDDYDRLSPLGEEQSRRLGTYWARQGLKIDAVYIGPCLRHRQTADLAGETYSASGLGWPEPILLPGLDEYQAQEMLRRSVPELEQRDERFAGLRRLFDESKGRPEHVKHFQRMFETAALMWAKGELEADGVQPWAEFLETTTAAYREICSLPGRGRTVAAFTSGGPMAVALRLAHDLDPLKTLRTSWIIKNSAVSEFLYSGARFSLSTFNTLAHLDDPSVVSYW